MDSLRRDLKNILRNNLYLEFESHEAMVNEYLFHAKLKILEHMLDSTITKILDRVNNVT